MIKPLPPTIPDLVRKSDAYLAAFDHAVGAAFVTVCECQFALDPRDAVQNMKDAGGFTRIAGRAVEAALVAVPGCFDQQGRPPVTANVARVLRSDIPLVADRVRALASERYAK